MRFLLTSLGSHGDVHPYVGIGRALRQRGHDVTLLANGHFEHMVRAAGLEYLPIGTDAEFRRLADNPDLWHPRRGFYVVFGLVLESLELHYGQIVRHIEQHPDTTVVASSLCFAARCAQDKLGFPMATVHLSPAVFRSCIDPPRLPMLYMPRWYPRWLKRTLWNGGDTYVLDPFLAPRLNAFRAGIGLEPVRHVLRHWWNSPDRVIGLFPDWYAPRQDDWPEQTRLSGFPLYDERDQVAIDPALNRFLNDGLRPIAFTPGSAMVHGREFFTAACDACRQLGRRGLLLTRHAEQLPRSLPPGVLHVPYAPFGLLLPRVAALVHHGGMGTTAQAMCAGTPQLVMRMAHDQLDNARRLERLGVGDEIRPSRFTGTRVAARLNRLLTDPQVARACDAVARRFEGIDGISLTCDLLEALGDARSNPAIASRMHVAQ